MLYVKDLITEKVHEFRNNTEVAEFLNVPYQIPRVYYTNKYRLRGRYVLSLDTEFNTRKRRSPDEKSTLWVVENNVIKEKYCSYNDLAIEYDIPLKTIQLSVNKHRLVKGYLRFYTIKKTTFALFDLTQKSNKMIKKKQKPDMAFNGEFKKPEPNKQAVRIGKHGISKIREMLGIKDK